MNATKLMDALKSRNSVAFKEALKEIEQDVFDRHPVGWEDAVIDSLQAKEQALLEVIEELMNYQVDLT